MVDFEREEVDIDSLDYFNVQNLSFNNPFNNAEKDLLKKILFSINNLQQIYFKDNIDVKSIETVKNLLSLSGYVIDFAIEKYIVKVFKDKELRKIIFANYENPDTWNVAYDFYDNHFFLEKIPACREFFNYLDRIDLIIEKENLSPFEKILRIYDIVKILEYDPNDLLESLDLLPSIISTSKASSLGFNRLFYYILKKYKFNIYIAKIKTENERISYISLVYLKDKKYNLDGIYVFDPSMDSLPKDNYKSDEIRLLNYNYFGLKLVDINNSLYGDTLVGALAILAIEDYSYSKEKRLTNKNQEITREFKELEDTFKMDFETLHNNLSLVSSIPFSTLKECIKNVYGEATTLKDYDKLFDENYRRRKKELFRENIDEMLETMLK